MQNVKQALEMCKVVVDGLIVADKTGLSYNVASMIELSGHISVALADVESRLTKRALDEVHAERTMSMSCPSCHRLVEVVLLASLRQ